MFTLFRYGLIPVALYSVIVIAAGFDAYSTNAVRKSTWPRTVATVVDARDVGQALAEFRGTQNSFPDPYGTIRYVVDGKTYTWKGRGRDIGMTAMNPGDKIEVFYDPKNPIEISTLVLLGAFTGNIILAVAIAFLAFYIWFFWLRRFLGRSTPPDDSDGGRAGAFADRVVADHIARSRAAPGDRRPPGSGNRPPGPSFNGGPRTTFGKR